MKMYLANQRALNFHAISQLAITFLLFSETSCFLTKYVYEGPDGCNSKNCLCTTETKVDDKSLVTTKITACYNLSSYTGPGEFFVKRIPQPVVNGVVKVRGYVVNKVNQARSYCQNSQINDNFGKAKENMALKASELKNKIGSTYDTTKGKLGTYWQAISNTIFGEKAADNVVVSK